MSEREVVRANAERVRREMVALLVEHQRKNNGGGCHCGWNVLGASYAEHVADVILSYDFRPVVWVKGIAENQIGTWNW